VRGREIMTEHARCGVSGATETADEAPRETVGHSAGSTAELDRLFVDLLGGQVRHGLRVAAALWRAVAWEEIVRAQGVFFHAGLEWWDRLNAGGATRPEQGRGTPVRTRGHLVRDIVGHRCPVVARPDETAQAAAARMAEGVCRSVLVCDGDRLCGILTERDLVTRVVGRGLDPGRTRLAEVMTRDPDRIEGAEPAREALRRMDGSALRHLPVVEGGRVLGVVSLPDLPVETLAGMLSELERWHALAERMR
jgi:predicted transcriptional regulator